MIKRAFCWYSCSIVQWNKRSTWNSMSSIDKIDFLLRKTNHTYIYKDRINYVPFVFAYACTEHVHVFKIYFTGLILLFSSFVRNS